MTAATLFFAFVLGLTGEAYGLHHDHGEAPGPSASAGAAGHVHQEAEVEDVRSGPAPLGPRAGPVQETPEGGSDSEGRTSDSAPDDAPCTCLGICHGASASPLPSAPPAVTHRAADPVTVSWPADDPGPLRASTPYLLPFANGPPAG